MYIYNNGYFTKQSLFAIFTRALMTVFKKKPSLKITFNDGSLNNSHQLHFSINFL